MRSSKLSSEQLQQVEYLLYLSDDLRSAYYLKEKFYEAIDCQDSQQAKELIYKWILLFKGKVFHNFRGKVSHNFNRDKMRISSPLNARFYAKEKTSIVSYQGLIFIASIIK